ncbi:hypothetical protein TNIN_141341 [Trichonephila inaurata madagascariensis]|uniref:Uncharacterized protein n=1 Tax=Trichonephila inaurata madagascariensis TaxID=2747483 RepID=A0A8X7C1Z9_9ARAC|nr:hypothetical protein TNIN_141341 [Trichonephila inaurata madagascariensis]
MGVCCHHCRNFSAKNRKFRNKNSTAKVCVYFFPSSDVLGKSFNKPHGRFPSREPAIDLRELILKGLSHRCERRPLYEGNVPSILQTGFEGEKKGPI